MIVEFVFKELKRKSLFIDCQLVVLPVLLDRSLSSFLFVENSTCLFLASDYTFCRRKFNFKLLSDSLDRLFVDDDSFKQNCSLLVGNDRVFHLVDLFFEINYSKKRFSSDKKVIFPK